MGLTRSPEISEMIDQNKCRIESGLDFLRECLRQDEQITLEILITKTSVNLGTNVRIDIGKADSARDRSKPSQQGHKEIVITISFLISSPADVIPIKAPFPISGSRCLIPTGSNITARRRGLWLFPAILRYQPSVVLPTE
jgi:hypothetical protein